MTGSSLFSNSFLGIFAIMCAHGVKIQLFKNSNFTESALESHSPRRCNNIPVNKIVKVYSIRTDTCFIAYSDFGCASFRSDKYLPGDIVPSDSQLGWYTWIRSFKICNEEEGGNELNLDITTFIYHYYGPRQVLESYKNVCSCVNVPQYVQNMFDWSIINHHNSLLAYYLPDFLVRKWSPTFITAGYNLNSISVSHLKKVDTLMNTTYKIQSLGPDPNSTYFKNSCMNSSNQLTTGNNEKNLESTLEGVNVADDEKNNGSVALANQNVKLGSSYLFVYLIIYVFIQIY